MRIITIWDSSRKLINGDKISELKLPNTKGGQFDIDSIKGKKLY